MNFKAPGLWTATITGVTTTGDLEPLTTTFVIADGTTVTTLPQQGLKVGTTTSPPTTVPPTMAPTIAPTIAPTVPPTVAPSVPAAPVVTTLPPG
jgi:hypothetical protein